MTLKGYKVLKFEEVKGEDVRLRLCPATMALFTALLIGESMYLLVNTVLGNFSGAIASMVFFAIGILLIALISQVIC